MRTVWLSRLKMKKKKKALGIVWYQKISREDEEQSGHCHGIQKLCLYSFILASCGPFIHFIISPNNGQFVGYHITLKRGHADAYNPSWNRDNLLSYSSSVLLKCFHTQRPRRIQLAQQSLSLKTFLKYFYTFIVSVFF